MGTEPVGIRHINLDTMTEEEVEATIEQIKEEKSSGIYDLLQEITRLKRRI